MDQLAPCGPEIFPGEERLCALAALKERALPDRALPVSEEKMVGSFFMWLESWTMSRPKPPLYPVAVPWMSAGHQEGNSLIVRDDVSTFFLEVVLFGPEGRSRKNVRLDFLNVQWLSRDLNFDDFYESSGFDLRGLPVLDADRGNLDAYLAEFDRRWLATGTCPDSRLYSGDYEGSDIRPTRTFSPRYFLLSLEDYFFELIAGEFLWSYHDGGG